MVESDYSSTSSDDDDVVECVLAEIFVELVQAEHNTTTESHLSFNGAEFLKLLRGLSVSSRQQLHLRSVTLLGTPSL